VAPTAARPEPARPRPRGEVLAVLRLLAEAGADRVPVVWTSRELGTRIGVSQQAADRYLVDLERRGLVVRTLAARRQRLQLTPAAMQLLRAEYHGYRRIFEGPARIVFSGEVSSGLGEGRYYLSQPGYVVQFTERLGYAPFPGTLNVRLAGPDLRRLEVVAGWRGLRIDGFQATGRTFGGATCYPAHLNGRACHLIRPDRSHYRDVVEFIARESLRDLLGVKDGARVEIVVEET
jgi:riboflavin kinase, archaea type